MTRKGSLAFYFAAWVCGTFFVSLGIWLRDLLRPGTDHITIGSDASLIFLCFYGTYFGFVASLGGAFGLRAMMRVLKARRAWQWALAGAVLAPVVIVSLGSLARHSQGADQFATSLQGFIAYGPSVVLGSGWWLAIPSGALTALILHAIDRAFASQQSPTAG